MSSREITTRVGEGGEETRCGTKKRCFHNLQSGHPAWWSADNCSIFLTVNIFRLFRSKKRTGRGNQNAKRIEKNTIVYLCFSCISYLFFGTEIAGKTVLDLNQQQCARSIYRSRRFSPGKDNLMLIKITGESVKFIGSKYIQRAL